MNSTKIKIIFCISLISSFSFAQNESPQFTAEMVDSVNNSAGITSGQNMTGQAMSMIQGGMHVSKAKSEFGRCSDGCGSCCSRGAMQLALGLLSFQQGRAHGKTAGAANLTGFLSDGTGAYDTANTDPYSRVDESNPLSADPTFKKAVRDLKDLKNAGIYNDKNGTIKVKDQTYKVSDFKTASGMKAAGMPQGAIDGALDYAKKLSQAAAEKVSKLKLGSLTEASGYAEGGGGTKSLGEASVETAAYGGGAVSALPIDRNPSNLAGMQKNYNGEPIGVAADSIFLMMNRRYKVKESQDSFYNESDMALQK